MSSNFESARGHDAAPAKAPREAREARLARRRAGLDELHFDFAL